MRKVKFYHSHDLDIHVTTDTERLVLFTDVNGPIDLIVNIYLDVDVVKDYILLNYIEIQ